MLTTFRRHLQDSQILASLCSAAEEIARGHGHAKPGSEHFVLAALGMADRTTIEAFKRLSLTEQDFLGALESQQKAALVSVGIARPATLSRPFADALLPPKARLYEADASGQSLVQRLADSRAARTRRNLLGADVLLSVAQESHSRAGRAFRALGVTAQQITDAASAAITSHAAQPDQS